MNGPADVLVLRFADRGDWAALHAARAWCNEHGVSYGPTDRTDTIALIAEPDVLIAKWHNLTRRERAEVDGTIAGDARNGPLTLRISRTALTRLGGAS